MYPRQGGTDIKWNSPIMGFIHYLYSVCHTLSRGFLKLTLTGPRRLESQRNVKYTFYLRQVKFFSQFKTIFYHQNMNVYLTY